MKKILNKKVSIKISVKSLLVLMMVVIAVAVALASRPTQIVATLSPDITIMYNGVVQTPRDGNGNITYPLLYNGTTYLPVRAVSNILGIDVGWNQNTRTVSLGTGGTVTPPSGSGSIPGSGGQVNVYGTTQYSFTPNQSGAWTFRTSNNNGDPYLWLYNSAGSLIAQDDDSGGSLNALMTVSLNAGSTYTVRAGFYSTGTGSYTLTVTPPSQTSSGSISGSGGQVNVYGTTRYSFTPNQSGVWMFRTSNNNGDPYLWIYNSNGSLIAEDDDNGGSLNALIYVNLNAGSTYTVVAGFYGNGTGSYTLSVGR